MGSAAAHRTPSENAISSRDRVRPPLKGFCRTADETAREGPLSRSRPFGRRGPHQRCRGDGEGRGLALGEDPAVSGRHDELADQGLAAGVNDLGLADHGLAGLRRSEGVETPLDADGVARRRSRRGRRRRRRPRTAGRRARCGGRSGTAPPPQRTPWRTPRAPPPASCRSPGSAGRPERSPGCVPSRLLCCKRIARILPCPWRKRHGYPQVTGNPANLSRAAKRDVENPDPGRGERGRAGYRAAVCRSHATLSVGEERFVDVSATDP